MFEISLTFFRKIGEKNTNFLLLRFVFMLESLSGEKDMNSEETLRKDDETANKILQAISDFRQDVNQQISDLRQDVNQNRDSSAR